MRNIVFWCFGVQVLLCSDTYTEILKRLNTHALKHNNTKLFLSFIFYFSATY
jgi:hypothetical protein